MMLGRNIYSQDVLKRIPKNSVGVEIGVWKGESSERFLTRSKHLHLVDPWSCVAYEDSDEFGDYQGYLARYSKLVGSPDPQKFQQFYDNVAASVKQKFANSPVTIHRCTSDELFATFSEQVDWVYVDALHSFEGCLSDLRNCLNIVKPGGVILGDDYYDRKPGVVQAVDAFVKETGLSFELFATHQYEIKVPA